MTKSKVDNIKKGIIILFVSLASYLFGLHFQFNCTSFNVNFLYVFLYTKTNVIEFIKIISSGIFCSTLVTILFIFNEYLNEKEKTIYNISDSLIEYCNYFNDIPEIMVSEAFKVSFLNFMSNNTKSNNVNNNDFIKFKKFLDKSIENYEKIYNYNYNYLNNYSDSFSTLLNFSIFKIDDYLKKIRVGIGDKNKPYRNANDVIRQLYIYINSIHMCIKKWIGLHGFDFKEYSLEDAISFVENMQKNFSQTRMERFNVCVSITVPSYFIMNLVSLIFVCIGKEFEYKNPKNFKKINYKLIGEKLSKPQFFDDDEIKDLLLLHNVKKSVSEIFNNNYND